MRLRVAEIDQDPDAHISRDEAFETRYDLGHGTVIAANQIPQILGIVPHGQCGRADEIAEHHRELAALNKRRSYSGVRTIILTQRSDRSEQFAAMPHRADTDFPEILGGQFGQYCGVDRVVAKRLFVSLQSETVEPGPDVHARLPDAVTPRWFTLAQTDAARECSARHITGRGHAVHDAAMAVVVGLGARAKRGRQAGPGGSVRFGQSRPFCGACYGSGLPPIADLCADTAAWRVSATPGHLHPVVSE